MIDLEDEKIRLIVFERSDRKFTDLEFRDFLDSLVDTNWAPTEILVGDCHFIIKCIKKKGGDLEHG